VIDTARQLELARLEATRLADAAEQDLEAPIVACPGWTAAKLVTHVGRIYLWVDRLVEAAPETAERHIEAPDGDEVISWFRVGAAHALDSLAGMPPLTPVSSWAGLQTAGWWARRLANETTVHRWDAQSAVGTPDTVDADLAVDGVDEYLHVFLPLATHRSTWSAAGAPAEATVHLHATDVDGEWMIRIGDTAITAEHGHGKGDVAVRGRAADLFLLVWGRADLSGLETFGDASLLERFLASCRV
jgi:uncharacterized protein (TIGR03083 family)